MEKFTPLETLDLPVERRAVTTDVFLYDFGLDAYGRLDLAYAVGEDTTLEIAFGEVLEADGRLNRNPGGSRIAFVVPVSLKKGEGICAVPIPGWRNPYGEFSGTPIVDPPITVFRYVEITGRAERAEPRRKSLRAPFNDAAASFECSDETLTRVWNFCKYAIKATTPFGVYVDGNRERLPYEGDTYINQLGHFALDADYAIAKRTIEHLMGPATWPTEWALIMVPVVYDYYLHSGDLDSLRRWYEPLKGKLLPQYVNAETGLLSTAGSETTHDIVDWPAGERDDYEFGDVNLVPNCYLVRALRTMALIDTELGFDADAQDHIHQAEVLKRSIRANLMPGGMFVDSIGSTHLSLHSAVFALWAEVAEPAEIGFLKERIVEKGMACSVYVAQFLLEVCFQYGMEDHAIKLMTSDSERSWVNMMRKGATITMEAWDDRFKPNQDWNHAWGAAPANVVARGIFGIRPTKPGFADYAVNPQLGGLEYARYRYPTPRGTLLVEVDRHGVRSRLCAGCGSRARSCPSG